MKKRSIIHISILLIMSLMLCVGCSSGSGEGSSAGDGAGQGNEIDKDFIDNPVMDTMAGGDSISEEEYARADAKVKELVENGAYSKKGLIAKMIEEGFKENLANSAVSYASIDFNEQATKYAKSLLNGEGYSAIMISSTLKEASFTQEQVEWALHNCGADYKKEASLAALTLSKDETARHTRETILRDIKRMDFKEEEYTYAMANNEIDWNNLCKAYIDTSAETMGDMYSRPEYIPMLVNGFTLEEIQYGIANCNIDWKAQAARYLNRHYEDSSTKKELIEFMIENEFTEEEALYAIDNCEIDWKEQSLRAIMSHLSIADVTDSLIKEFLTENGFNQEEIDYALAAWGY